MSALPLVADIRTSFQHDRFGPLRDVTEFALSAVNPCFAARIASFTAQAVSYSMRAFGSEQCSCRKSHQPATAGHLVQYSKSTAGLRSAARCAAPDRGIQACPPL